MANISKVYLLNTPLEDDMKNTLYFANASAQQTYMNNNIIKSYTNVSYQRDTSTFRCPAQIDTIRNCNYIMFQNTAYSNKWFYGFIKKMVYVNDNFTDVEFEVDPLQTFMFDITLKPSFIEREHTNNDTFGNNTVPENVELGEYISSGVHQSFVYNMVYTYFVIAVSEILNNMNNPNPSNVYLPNGLYYIAVKSDAAVKAIIKMYDTAGKGSAVYAVFVAPQECFPSDKWTTTASLPTNYEYSVSPSYTFSTSDTFSQNHHLDNDYYPRNAKLLTYPYRFLQASNNAGAIANYNYEDFASESMKFDMRFTLGAGGNGRVFPENYKKREKNYDEGITFGKFPIGSWQSDVYINWLTQNAVNIPVSIASDVAQTAIGVAGSSTGVGAAGAVASGLSSIASTVGQIYQHSKQPPQAEGNINNGDVNFAYSMTGIFFNQLSIKKEYARIIDDFFDMFGYATHRVKVPNKAHRQNWWYTKTIDANITGNVPNDYMNQIKGAYNNGITFWRNPSNFLDYSVSNGIV